MEAVVAYAFLHSLREKDPSWGEVHGGAHEEARFERIRPNRYQGARRVLEGAEMTYITTCCKFKFIGLNHSPEQDGVCRNCGGVYGHDALKGKVTND